jgi:hypothetical protein
MYGKYWWNTPLSLKIDFNKDFMGWSLSMWKFGMYYTNWNKAYK